MRREHLAKARGALAAIEEAEQSEVTKRLGWMIGHAEYVKAHGVSRATESGRGWFRTGAELGWAVPRDGVHRLAAQARRAAAENRQEAAALLADLAKVAFILRGPVNLEREP